MKEMEQYQEKNTKDLRKYINELMSSMIRKPYSLQDEDKIKTIKPWGELSEQNLSMIDLMILSELCHNVSESRMEYLVTLYNSRDIALDPVEAHFVAHYAKDHGYDMLREDNNQTKFIKRK